MGQEVVLDILRCLIVDTYLLMKNQRSQCPKPVVVVEEAVHYLEVVEVAVDHYLEVVEVAEDSYLEAVVEVVDHHSKATDSPAMEEAVVAVAVAEVHHLQLVEKRVNSLEVEAVVEEAAGQVEQ